jgi:hypothetical protein
MFYFLVDIGMKATGYDLWQKTAQHVFLFVFRLRRIAWVFTLNIQYLFCCFCISDMQVKLEWSHERK